MSDEPNLPTESAEQKGADNPTSPQKKKRAKTVLQGVAWFQRTARLWGFLGFVVFVLVLARSVILPFVFAMLVAYILAPLVHRMSLRPDGSKRMPKGLAIIICYLVILAILSLFFVILLPRVSTDIARIGGEVPKVYQRLNEEWAPSMARWVEARFPSVAESEDPAPPPVPTSGVPVPKDASFVVTPLADGRYAIAVGGPGLELAPRAGGGYSIRTGQKKAGKMGLEDRIRDWAAAAASTLQNQLGSFVRFGQELLGAAIRSVFTFFLVLMIAAFIMLDLEKLYNFVRSLVPKSYRGDFDIILVGVDKGLSGVIRGQLMICLVNGILTYIGLLIFDVKYSIILACVAAVLSLIPIFGSILSTVPIVITALVSGEGGLDVAGALFVLAWIVGIHFLEANLLNPKIIGTAAKIHPVLVIFALIAGEHSYGLVGALLAVPVASIIQVCFVYLRGKVRRSDVGEAHLGAVEGQRSV